MTPIYFGPGLSDPEPIGKFLNGTFSGITSDKKPYVTAYQNLTFNSPINFTTVPSQSRIIVGQRDGKVYWFDDDENTIDKNLLLDLSDEVGVVWDGGFLGLSIHPSFGASGSNYFYIYYTTKSSDTTLNSPLGFSCGLERFHGNYLHLERFEVDPLNMSFISDSRLTMVKMRMYNTTHRGGGMEFGDDGYLYLSTGDQAAYKNAQDISNNLDGGVLRLDVDENIFKSHAPIRKLGIDAGENDEFSGVGYMIPNSNPFNNSDGTVFEEYFSIGHRNPHRLTKDKITGKFYIGEIGENTHDEINVLSGGGNYGWPLYEGNDSFNSNCISSLYNNMLHKRPLTEFPRHDSNSLIGGYVYRGSNMPNLVGKYICADYGIGDEIWSVDVDTGQYEILGNFIPENIISFGQDYQGELYMLKLGDNVNLYKLEYANVDMNNVPQLLSETGVFKDLEKLVVNEGIIPFSLIDPFWSDGAYKKRWMVIPNDGTHDLPEEQISFSENGIWEFPKGAVLIKHFDYPIDDRNPNITRKVETRFSIKGEDDNFYFLTYNWNAEQTDAILQKVGIDEPIQITTENGNSRQINWHFPSNTECLSCHNSASKGTLGTRTRFLNNNFDYSSHIPEGVVANQLVTLSNLGILDTTILDEDTSSFFTHTSINNLSASVQDRARSYLDLNCAYCHQPETGNRANFDLRAINSLAQTGLLTAGANQQLTDLSSDQRIIYPGDASKSQLHHRTASKNPNSMMPPLAKNEIDLQGVSLIEEWINQMEPISTLPVAGDYRIVNLGTGLTLQVSDGGLVDKSNVIVGSYNELESQHFALESTVTGHYGLRALHSGHYVDVSWANMSANANVWQYTGNGSDAQLWEIRSSGAGTFQMVSKLSGHFLGSQANGNVAVYPDNGSNAVLWRFVGLDEVQELEVTAIPDQSVVEGSSVTFTVAAHGGDVSLPIIYSASGLPEGVAISPESGVVSGAPEIGSSIGGPFSDGTYYVTVTATRGDEGSTVDFIWEVTSGTVAAPVDGEAVFRIKSAGPTQVSTDEGPDWLGGAPSGAYIGTGYSVNTGVSAPATGMIYDNRHSSIPSYIDAVTYEALFSNERWDGSGIPEMQYSIPLPNGDYTINLYLGNFCTCTDEIGERIFGIAIEGEEVRSALDLISEFGHLSGGMLSYPVTLTDGSLQIEFIHGTENPVVNAIEIRDNNKKTGIQLKSLYTIENNSIIHKITVYPNPVKISQNINVIVPSDFYGKMFRLEFYSVQGSKVLVSEKTVLENNNLKFKVDDGLASGVYIIRLFIDNILMKSQKVIIE
ncbi:PQQ-dependent sugar dehydrogenase [Maribacter dokdonensis]|uniref:PQQ-dependent sugar dehydrogenase n=1 Tax=Maribacter dokdonensis TaxID=320912 RepID=UPI002AB1275F|nr:PQQ-dependent sugar dehydrogenase [Maribacter dokdonensis]